MAVRRQQDQQRLIPLARMVHMIHMLCAQGRTMAELEEEFHLTSRQIKRYLKTIGERGYDFVEYDGIGKRVYKIEGGHRGLKPIPITDSELMAFHLAQSHMEYLTGTPFTDDLASLNRKFRNQLTERTANKIEQMAQVFFPVQRPQRAYAKQKDILAALQKALLLQREVTITHRAQSYRDPVTHVVEPYGLELFNYGLYLVGYSHRAKDFRRFAVERIQKATVDMTADPFTIKPEYAARAKSRKAFGLTEGNMMDVKVQFSREVADYFTERQWHPTQKVRKLKNGDVIVSFQAGGIDEIVSWVLSWGQYAKVLDPLELALAVQGQINATQKQYVDQRVRHRN